MCVCVWVKCVSGCVAYSIAPLEIRHRLLPPPLDVLFCFFARFLCFFRLPHATQFHPHRQLHLRLQPDCGGVSCCFVSYSVQSVLGGCVGGCVGSRGQSRRMWNARIHVHCYLHLLLHLWSADVAVHWQWIVVVVVVVVALVFEVLEVEAVEMWVWGWRLCMHRSGSGSGSEIDSAHVRMNVQFGHLHAHSARVRRICSLARSVAHSNLPTDHDTLAHAAHKAEAVAHGVLALGSDGDGKSCPYHIGTHCYSSAGFGLCSSRDTGIVRVIGKSELSCEQKAQSES